MKRHPSLEAFSRDHNVGLVLGRRLEQSATLDGAVRSEAAATLVRYWDEEMEDHFAEEERLLIPLIPSAEHRDRQIAEHRELAAIIADMRDGQVGPDRVALAGKRLGEHIRWEERTVFPAIENAASALDLQKLAEETARLESRRSDSTWSPRRPPFITSFGKLTAALSMNVRTRLRWPNAEMPPTW